MSCTTVKNPKTLTEIWFNIAEGHFAYSRNQNSQHSLFTAFWLTRIKGPLLSALPLFSERVRLLPSELIFLPRAETGGDFGGVIRENKTLTGTPDSPPPNTEPPCRCGYGRQTPAGAGGQRRRRFSTLESSRRRGRAEPEPQPGLRVCLLPPGAGEESQAAVGVLSLVAPCGLQREEGETFPAGALPAGPREALGNCRRSAALFGTAAVAAPVGEGLGTRRWARAWGHAAC